MFDGYKRSHLTVNKILAILILHALRRLQGAACYNFAANKRDNVIADKSRLSTCAALGSRVGVALIGILVMQIGKAYAMIHNKRHFSTCLYLSRAIFFSRSVSG